jgi:hypothetical protein
MVCKLLFGTGWWRSDYWQVFIIKAEILLNTTCSVLSGNKHYILYTEIRFSVFVESQKD